MTTYAIHNNGTVPFTVVVNNNDILVRDNHDQDVLHLENCEKIFLGIDTNTGEDGNSILVRMPQNRYVYIGYKIFDFVLPDDTILGLFSPIWGADVSYGLGIGENFIYFFATCSRVGRPETVALMRRMPRDNIVLPEIFNDYTDTTCSTLYEHFFAHEDLYFSGEDHDLDHSIECTLINNGGD